MKVKYDFSKKIGESDFSKEWEGFVELDMPKAHQRFQYLKESGIELNKDGEVNISIDTLGAMSKLIEAAESHIVKVELFHKESETTFKSFEDLQYYAECSEIINFIAGQIVNGARLGKK